MSKMFRIKKINSLVSRIKKDIFINYRLNTYSINSSTDNSENSVQIDLGDG